MFKGAGTMDGISLSTANLLSFASNIALVLGAILALAGTGGAIWTSGIKERYADVRTKANEAETANAKAAAAIANAEAAKANESAEIVRASNLALQADVERERTARLQLENKVAPRHLSEAHKGALMKALTPLAGSKVHVISALGDAEARAFADDFISVFKAAGWNLGEGASEGVFEGSRGITVVVNQGNLQSNIVPRGANELFEAVTSLGLTNAKGFCCGQTPPEIIAFMVGSKPE